MIDSVHLAQLFWTVVYAALGVAIYFAVFWLLTKVTPFSVRKEIEQDQNTALAVIYAAAIIGVSIIIAAAIT